MLKKIVCSWQLYLCIAVIIAVVISAISNKDRSYVAERVLKDLCTYTTYNERVSQILDLSNCTTAEVYDQITSIDEDSLFKLISLEGKYCEPVIIKITSSYIIYYLKCEYIEPSRRFVFFYETDASDRLCEVREGELNDFIKYDESLY